MADNSFTKLPLAGQLGVSLLVAGLIGGVFWYFVWNPMVQDEAAKQKRLQVLRDENRVLESAAANLPGLQRKVADLEAKLETLKRILPPQKETPDLMRKVQYLAAQSNLTIKKFNPSATVNKEFYQEWPINVDVIGTYHNLGVFFDRVGRLSRLVNVGGVKIKAQTKQSVSNTIAASCVATTFVYLDQPIPPPGKGKGPAKGKAPVKPAAK
jgi:type IV pilus assembly protein PilO